MSLRCLALTCILTAAACSPAWSALALNPSNPHYFFETTTGKPFLIAGHGSLVPTSRAIDYVAEIKQNASAGTHYVRAWHWLPWEGDNAIWPWRRLTAPPAGMGGGRYDFNTWDPDYWHRLRDGISRCEKAGIYVEVMFFEACGMKHGDNRWLHNPWASDNNVNHLGLPDSSSQGVPAFYDIAHNPALRRQQERYVRKMIDETASFPNVLYELENEHYPGFEPAWTRHWSAFIKGYLASAHAGTPRLLSATTRFDVSFGTAAVDIVNFHSDSTDLASYNRFLEGNWWRGKAMNVDELANGQGSYDALRRICWTIITSGGNFHVEDALDSSKPYAVPANVLNFCKASAWDFVHAAPDHKLVVSGGGFSGYCMARPGVEYVCYFPKGGTNYVKLAPGRYTFRWWDPRLGGFSGEQSFDHSRGNRAFTTPTRDDWVLQIRARPVPKG